MSSGGHMRARRTQLPATRKGPPPHEGTAGLVNESQDPWIVTDTSRVAPSRAIVRLMVSPAR